MQIAAVINQMAFMDSSLCRAISAKAKAPINEIIIQPNHENT